jgi:hypothetical protein
MRRPLNQVPLFVILSIGLAIVLLIPHTNATNESSYKFGFHLAIDNLTAMVFPPQDADPPQSRCWTFTLFL